MPNAVPTQEPAQCAVRLLISGRVQGVGYRPFVYRQALARGLHGWVQNCRGPVAIYAQGPSTQLERFIQDILTLAPPMARPLLAQRHSAPLMAYEHFAIIPSQIHAGTDVHVPLDLYLCPECLTELHDPGQRRYRYPFISCTQCGPRYTILEAMPYDRAHTSMQGFSLCPACAAEYHDPNNRRFHAEAIACPQCGPQLYFSDGVNHHNDSEMALSAALARLRAGHILAVKGIGGYHLMCDARNAAAVARLRDRKHRPHKPLAVMFPDTLPINTYGSSTALYDTSRPIVLIAKNHCGPLAENIAPGLNEIGVMLPSSPLHALLLQDYAAPLVATSANISGEPLISEVQSAEQHLSTLCDAYLHHDRLISHPVDDSIYRVIAGTARPLRLGRGLAPLELTLPQPLSTPVLAVGGHLKNTVALAWDSRVVISAHIGDLSSVRGLQRFKHTINAMQDLYGVTAQAVAYDAHPRYASSRWAQHSGLTPLPVFHHHAHAAALAGEYPHESRWLVFTWDGLGYGPDNTLWGGEALLGYPGHWQRQASLRPFHVPGGEQALRAPWRIAATLCWEANIAWAAMPAAGELLHQAWQRRLNAPLMSAVGRLFDAAAALLGIIQECSYEAQAALLVEAAATDTTPALVTLPLYADAHGTWRCDWAPLLPMLLDEHLSVGTRAAGLHHSLAQTLLAQALKIRATHGDVAIGLTGGVFQNRLLAELARQALHAHGFRVYLPERLPCNDGGLCYGQVIEACYHLSLPRQ